jgi:hypothetical protein
MLAEDDFIEELRKTIISNQQQKRQDHRKDVLESVEYKNEVKYLHDFTFDFTDVLRAISIYSTRGGDIYPNFLTIRFIEELLESAVGILSLVSNGSHNMARREMRYLLELAVKYVIIDYELMGKPLSEKLEYLATNIPNSSIEVINRYHPPLEENLNSLFKNEVRDYFYKACAYVHPSKRQLSERLENQKNGATIGFETTKMLKEMNKIIFRGYDMILFMVFHGFGHSMSKDIFEQLLVDNKKWKFHKGKYIKYLKVTYRL